jgi:hypothetical protein
VRNALSNIVTVDIDERDLQQLEVAEDDDASQVSLPFVGNVRRSTADKIVRVATIDTFQGCEADIIILSTVRNQGMDDGSRAGFIKKTIGFLKVTGFIDSKASFIDASFPFY